MMWFISDGLKTLGGKDIGRGEERFSVTGEWAG